MPYIPMTARHELQESYRPPSTAGELNYCLSELIKYYWLSHHNYQGINDILGALDGASKEFYRRVAVPYEDGKIVENGDVYE